MTFRAGQKVVCVDDAPVGRGEIFTDACGVIRKSSGNLGGLRKGAIYTVCDIHNYPLCALVFLSEIPIRDTHDQGFRLSRFRPIVERKTDISIFKAMLNPIGENVS